MYELATENSNSTLLTTKDYQEAYQAYLLIYDANNIMERKRLLKYIIKNPYVCILFLTNCNPNEKEKQLILDTIVDDSRCSFLALDLIDSEDPMREELFLTVLNDPHYAYESSKKSLKPHEKQLVYQMYKNIYFNKTMTTAKYFEAYTIFNEYANSYIIKELINKIYKDQQYYFANCLLAMYNLPDHLKDKLESLFVIANLNGDSVK